MGNGNKQAKEGEEIYFVEYDTLRTGVKSPRVQESLIEKSSYDLKQASNAYVARIAEILEKEGVGANDPITARLSFVRRR